MAGREREARVFAIRHRMIEHLKIVDAHQRSLRARKRCAVPERPALDGDEAPKRLGADGGEPQENEEQRGPQLIVG